MLRRLANYLMLLIVASTMAYFLAAMSLNPRSNFEQQKPRPSIQQIDATLRTYNLDPSTPVVVRYAHWANGVIHGNLGINIKGDSVNNDFGRRLGVSTRLLVIATIIGSLGGVMVGAQGAIKQYRFFDRWTTLSSFFLLAMPVFVVAISLEIFAVDINQAAGTTVIQYIGEYNPDLSGFWPVMLSRLQHLILPTIALSLFQIAQYSRYQ